MIDLHAHSTCSDGSEPPESVVDLAVEAACSAIALTDHDECFGLAAARARAATVGIRFVPGCEVSCTLDADPLHLLCYFIDDQSSTFGALLRGVRHDRDERNRALAKRLAALGLPVSLEDATAQAKGRVVGRPHFAAVLVRGGMAASIEDAFDRWLGEDRPAYVARKPLPPRRVIAAAHDDGGLVALAHPLSHASTTAKLDRLVGQLASDGLDGLEAYYTSYDRATREELARLAGSKHLVATGGSDFHGAYRPGVRVGIGRGDLHVADAVLEELDARRR
jgi:3',5'-nucleoside bisphosphate phosphatase